MNRWVFLKKNWIYVLLFFLVLVRNLTWIYSIPIFQAPDENSHFEYVRFLAEFRTLPFFESMGWQSKETAFVSSKVGLSRIAFHPEEKIDFEDGQQFTEEILEFDYAPREGAWSLFLNIYSHPPLYYGTLAIPYSFLMNADFFTRFYILRLFSSLFSILTIVICFGMARKLLRHEWLAVACVFLLIFHPMFSFISASLNNDNLLVLMFALVFLLGLEEIDRTKSRKGRGVINKHNILWGLVLGGGMLTKFNFVSAILIFVAVKIYTIFLSTDKLRIAKRVFLELLFVGILVSLLAGWWYGLNIYHFGEPVRGSLTSTKSLIPVAPEYDKEIIKRKGILGNLKEAFSYRYRVVRVSFWARFGWLDTPGNLKTIRLANESLKLGIILWGLKVFYSLALKSKIGLKGFGSSLLIEGRRQGLLIIYLVVFDLFNVFWFLYVRYTTGRPDFPSQGRYYFPAILGLSLIVIESITFLRSRLIRFLVTLPLLIGYTCFYFQSFLAYYLPRYYLTNNILSDWNHPNTILRGISLFKPGWFSVDAYVLVYFVFTSLSIFLLWYVFICLFRMIREYPG